MPLRNHMTIKLMYSFNEMVYRIIWSITDVIYFLCTSTQTITGKLTPIEILWVEKRLKILTYLTLILSSVSENIDLCDLDFVSGRRFCCKGIKQYLCKPVHQSTNKHIKVCSKKEHENKVITFIMKYE